MGQRARRRPAAEARPRRSRDRALAARRDAARADRPAPDLRELLVGRRPGAVWPRLRALLRLGRRAQLRRARLRAGLHALRPLPRVLEPRLHGVRAARRRHAHAAAEGEHRHGPRPRAWRGDPPGRHVRLRHGRVPPDHGVDRRAVGRRVRRLGGGDEGAQDPGRPRSRDDVPRGRRRDAVERGSRLRPAADHPARRPAGAADRAPRRPSRSGRRRRADGRRIPGAVRAGG